MVRNGFTRLGVANGAARPEGIGGLYNNHLEITVLAHLTTYFIASETFVPPYYSCVNLDGW